MSDVAMDSMKLAGGDLVARVRAAAEAHQEDHGCLLHIAGPEVMQLTASYV